MKDVISLLLLSGAVCFMVSLMHFMLSFAHGRSKVGTNLSFMGFLWMVVGFVSIAIYMMVKGL